MKKITIDFGIKNIKFNILRNIYLPKVCLSVISLKVSTVSLGIDCASAEDGEKGLSAFGVSNVAGELSTKSNF